jgi:hypothetical protein
MRHTKYLFVIFIIILSVNKTSFALGKIVDYFLNNPNAWNDTKRITHSTPIKIVVEDGMMGLGLELTELTNGDEVALIFLETKKVKKMRHEGFCDARGKLIRGKNRVVSVITRNYGNRARFHYKFILQKYINNVPVTIYNNGDAVLECEYDGSMPVVNDSDLSGINFLEIKIR